ncbi:urate hydroxylase PuuD, partial [Oleiphilus sp. HI0067]
MEAYFLEWLNLFFRWFHVIAGVAWIGASFYFVWLDNSLENPPQWKKDKGIGGDLWAIHGGGFYEVAKYKLGPEAMPRNLHWFKWEAYTTWLTGMVMLWIVYYVGAESFLIDNSKLELSQWEAIGLGMSFIAIGFAVYEILVKTPLRYKDGAFGLVLFAFLAFSAWVADQLFSDRGAYIHVGALIGSIMAGNVFFGIMPSQRALVEAVQRGEAPDPKYGAFAKLRSTHNNYLTLPLIFIMISNHYPMTYSHEYGWAVLAAIIFITGFARHFFNLRHRGEFKPVILVIAAVMLVALAGVMA